MRSIKRVAVVLVVVLLFVSTGLNVYHYKAYNIREPVRDTIRVTYTDTIPFYKPVPKDSIIIRYVTERLPISTNDKPICADSVGASVNQQLCFDSISVRIPITQKMYEDSTYRAYVSGYNPNLDSLFVYPKCEIITIRETAKPKRWSIGIQTGYGITLKTKPKFVLYIGVGASYSLWQF
ncbi:MAG: hypothetical protein NC344_05645 [Bacteroidales bacterium]|nr:hypothetical protein [Bacteroidales bacterium]MCM1147303.1 hypothetical protein [Bacteroidales bacterium]MCM1206263.1 hypothetical protein [Bacillota bacterium]